MANLSNLFKFKQNTLKGQNICNIIEQLKKLILCFWNFKILVNKVISEKSLGYFAVYTPSLMHDDLNSLAI